MTEPSFADLTGRVALIAGGSGAIGREAAKLLAEAGAAVWIGYNKGAERAAEIVAGLGGDGHGAVRLPMEDSEAIARAVGEVEAAHGRLDILINSAGFTRAVPHADLDGLDDALFDAVMVANVRGPFATVRAAAPLMRRTGAAAGDAVIVNVSSIAGVNGMGSSIAYSASKAALDVMTKALARVLAPEIRVVSLSPAAVDTDFVPGRSHEDIVRQAGTSPLKKVMSAEDCALSILACITHLRFTTGAIVLADGGRTL